MLAALCLIDVYRSTAGSLSWRWSYADHCCDTQPSAPCNPIAPGPIGPKNLLAIFRLMRQPEGRRQRGSLSPTKRPSAPRQIRYVTGGVSAYFRTARNENLRGMDRAHHLPAAGRYAVPHQEPVEVDTLVAQRIALIDTDHHGRQALDVFCVGEARPSQWVAGLERLDAIAHGTAIVVHADQDALVVD